MINEAAAREAIRGDRMSRIGAMMAVVRIGSVQLNKQHEVSRDLQRGVNALSDSHIRLVENVAQQQQQTAQTV